MVEGFCKLDGGVPLPKSQVQEVGFPVDISVNLTVRVGHPATVEAEKSAVTCAEASKEKLPATSNQPKIVIKRLILFLYRKFNLDNLVNSKSPYRTNIRLCFEC